MKGPNTPHKSEPCVACSAENCVYQETGHCCAEHIRVQNKNAEVKSETFCDTFTPRAGI